MKNIIAIIFLIFLSNCGYSSVYKDGKSNDIFVNITSMQGDKIMNNLIRNQLELYSNKSSQNKYNIIISTNFQKIILAKDSSGAATNYQLTANSNFEVNFKGESFNFSFKESLDIKNFSDTFEQNNYENTIKVNFASSLREKLIIKLLEKQ